MSCSHGHPFSCPHCGECYQCDHVVVTVGDMLGWRCPDGFEKPAYGPSSPYYNGAM